eukprot:scaffold2075_cov444-Prasinococcus_capsulatus_cf.AAC.3
MHKNVMAYFANFVCGTEVLKAVLTQLLLYYTRLLELCKKSGPEGEALVAKDVPTIPEIMYEPSIRRIVAPSEGTSDPEADAFAGLRSSNTQSLISDDCLSERCVD